MNCAWAKDRLLLYASGELPSDQAAGVARHLAECARCGAVMDDLVETQAHVGAALETSIHAPASLHPRVMAAVRTLPPCSRRRIWPYRLGNLRLAPALAACVLLAAGFTAGRWSATARRDRSGAVPAEIAPAVNLESFGDVHLRFVNRRLPLSTAAGSDARRLSLALTPRAGFPVVAVDLRKDGAQLLGWSDATIRGARVVLLEYRFHGQRVTLFQMDGGKLVPPALGTRVFGADCYLTKKIGGLTYVAWRFGGTNNVMVASAVPMHHLFRLGCHACEQQEEL